MPVSENKVLCHPSSVDSLSTSAGTEDHVSMGGYSARKALTVVRHVEQGRYRYMHMHASKTENHILSLFRFVWRVFCIYIYIFHVS